MKALLFTGIRTTDGTHINVRIQGLTPHKAGSQKAKRFALNQRRKAEARGLVKYV